jgi:hypothetical protein
MAALPGGLALNATVYGSFYSAPRCIATNRELSSAPHIGSNGMWTYEHTHLKENIDRTTLLKEPRDQLSHPVIPCDEHRTCYQPGQKAVQHGYVVSRRRGPGPIEPSPKLLERHLGQKTAAKFAARSALQFQTSRRGLIMQSGEKLCTVKEWMASRNLPSSCPSSPRLAAIPSTQPKRKLGSSHTPSNDATILRAHC